MSWLSKVLNKFGRDSPEGKKSLMRLQLKPSDPLIVDRWFDVAYIALWFIYGLWGVTSLILGLPTIVQFTPDWYQPAWSGMIGLLSITAAILAILVFFDTPWMKQITKKYLERSVIIVLCSFVAVYPLLLTLRSIDGESHKTGGLSILLVSYIIFPVLRIHTLSKRIKALREVVVTNATRTR